MIMDTNRYEKVGWYQCECCPYGYHIDLDFVRYCESLEQQADRTGSIKKRKDRRRQRKSVEVLLGLSPQQNEPWIEHLPQLPEVNVDKKVHRSPPVPIRNRIGTSLVHDALNDAVFDFERTLERSNKPTPNLPDVTEVIRRSTPSTPVTPVSNVQSAAPLGSSDCSMAESNSISCDTVLSPIGLKHIRQQMALSLQRTIELEEEIPVLHVQIDALKEEKRNLLMHIKTLEQNNLQCEEKLNAAMKQNASNTQSRHSQQTTTANKQPIPPRRDFSGMCGAITRTVGVGNQYPHTRTVSTTTTTTTTKDVFTDDTKDTEIDSNFIPNMLIHNSKYKIPNTISKGTSTVSVDSRTAGCQTIDNKVLKCTVATHAKPATSEIKIEAKVETRTLGISDNAINDVLCVKCVLPKVSVGTGPETKMDSHTSPISLLHMNVPRSRSFNLGEEALNVKTKFPPKSKANYVDKQSQSEVKTLHKSMQSDQKLLLNKGSQYERHNVSKYTDVSGLDVVGRTEKKNFSMQADLKNPSVSVSTNTVAESVNKKEEVATPSKIPRLATAATTSVDARKFLRSDTYTVISVVPPPETIDEISHEKGQFNYEPRLSGLDLSRDTGASGSFEIVKDNYKLPDVSATTNSTQNGPQQPDMLLAKEQTVAEVESVPQCNTFSQGPREKIVPSKEMQAAIKVLNDCLQKSNSSDIKNQVKTPTAIIRKEWFKLSGTVDANPLDVEDYLDYFDEVSSVVLQHIVNIMDESGNTALHYAVSHGNFDVVTILLDSKVCNIDQLNKVGYTSVMLVSLAEVRSAAHAIVAKRLFQMADVNVRAKQHGQTALMLAVSHGRLDMVTMLLEAGADINIQDEDGSTALMCAAEHGHYDIVKHFLSHPDCDSSVVDVDGSTALKIAMEAGHRHIGVLLYAHEHSIQGSPYASLKIRKGSISPISKTPPGRNVQRALPDKKK